MRFVQCWRVSTCSAGGYPGSSEVQPEGEVPRAVRIRPRVREGSNTLGIVRVIQAATTIPSTAVRLASACICMPISAGRAARPLCSNQAHTSRWHD